MPSLKIWVKDIDGKSIEVEIDGDDTIENIKNKVTDKIGIPCRLQKLICDNIELKDNEKVSDKTEVLTRVNFTVHLIVKAGISERDIHRSPSIDLSVPAERATLRTNSDGHLIKNSSKSSKFWCCKCSII